MWNFPQYMSREQTFRLFQDTLETARAGVGTGVWAFKTGLRIPCKPSSEYLETLVVTLGVTVIGSFVPESLAGYLNNSSPNSRGGEESENVTKGVTEEVAEGVTEEVTEGRS